MKLSGRVALVVGASSGLGRSIAKKLAEDGARVAVLARRKDELEALAAEISGLALPCDVRDIALVEASITRTERELGPLSIYVHSAGIASSAPLAKTDDASWNETFDVNVTAPFRIARLIAPMMATRKYGRIVFIASNAGLTGYAYTAAYTASKHAVVGLTRALAAEFAKTGVTVNAVCPGFLDTPMTDRSVDHIVATAGRSAEEARAALSKMSPLRRLIRVEEVSHVVAMLVGNDAQAVNGTAIPVDGGQVMT